MEVMISFFILVVGLTGALSVIVSTGNTNSAHKNRFIAANLAQEAIEAVRNMRDTNWLVYSSNLRECWNFWDDEDENGVINSDDEACTVENGQNTHPFGRKTTNPDGSTNSFIADFDPDTFRWVLVSGDRLGTGIPGIHTSKDYGGGYQLYERIFNGRSFYTHNREDANHKPSPFSREVEIYYIDNTNFLDNGNGTFVGGEFPDTGFTEEENKEQDNRMLVVVRMSWFDRGNERELVLSTLLTDFFARTEWKS